MKGEDITNLYGDMQLYMHLKKKTGVNLKNQKQPISCVDNLWYMYMMKYYSVVKRNGLLNHLTTSMNLWCFMRNERSPTHKITYFIFSFL